MSTKVCTVCKSEKSLEEFYRNSETADGRLARCKLCVKDYNKQYYAVNCEREKARVLAWKQQNSKARIVVGFLLAVSHS